MKQDAKSALRVRFRNLRRELAPIQRQAEEQANDRLLEELLAHLAPPALAAYQAVRGECDPGSTVETCWRRSFPVLLPRVTGPGRLAWHRVLCFDDLRSGAFDIPEPDPDRCPEQPLPRGCLVLVPGLAFGADGRRLGQGGGFYDRLDSEGLIRLALGFRCQRCDFLPEEVHDRRCEGVLLGGELLLDPRIARA